MEGVRGEGRRRGEAEGDRNGEMRKRERKRRRGEGTSISGSDIPLLPKTKFRERGTEFVQKAQPWGISLQICKSFELQG